MKTINKKKRDIISEQEFNRQLIREGVSPWDDSRGDSDEILSEEFLAGMSYERSQQEPVVPADENSLSGTEIPDESGPLDATDPRLNNNTRVISAESPILIDEIDKPLETH